MRVAPAAFGLEGGAQMKGGIFHRAYPRMLHVWQRTRARRKKNNLLLPALSQDTGVCLLQIH